MPDTVGWDLLPAAKADLAKIWTDGAAEWGMDQADRYADGLFSLFDVLAEFPEMARERVEFSPAVRIHPGGSHLVIYRQAGPGIEVIRLLHVRQDLMTYLLEG